MTIINSILMDAQKIVDHSKHFMWKIENPIFEVPFIAFNQDLSD